MKENYRFQSLFFVGLPDLRKLCSLTVVLNCDDADAKSLQTITCRELLFLYPDILVAPGEHKEIIVIMPIAFYRSGNIQAFAQKHRRKADIPQRVIPAVLQICLSFTLVARLSPSWNKAGHLLIHGKDFLRNEGRQNAVVMELNVSETQVCISVEASTIRLPLAKIEDFDITTGVLKNFHNKRIAIIPKHFIASNWCYVLPSMKKGQIVSIGHEIPPDCPFRSYGDFQKHWKNMYGYNLPEINSDMALYYTVYFKLIGEKLFTYPFCCIRSEPVQFYPRVDLESVVTTFFSDLKITFSSLCGLPIKITSKPYYATNELSVSQAVQARPPNLTTKPTFKNSLTRIPAAKVTISKTSSIYSINGSQKTTVLDNEQKLDIKASLDAASIHATGLCESIFKSTEKPEVVFQNLQKGTIQVAGSVTYQQMEMHSSSTNQASRIIPIFKNRLLKQGNSLSSRINEKKTKQNENSKKTSNLSNANINRKTPMNVQERECSNEKVDLFDKAQKRKTNTYTNVTTPTITQVQNSSSDSMVNMCKDTLLLKSNPRMLKSGDTTLKAFRNIQDQSNINTQFGGKRTPGPTTFDHVCTKWIHNLLGNEQKQVSGVFDIKKQEKQTNVQQLSSKSLTALNYPDKGTEKRKCEEKVSDSKPKKTKTKPVIQDVDVEKHAKNDQLFKVNSATLQSWLKCRGVSVRTRDKKEQLVSKIMEFIKGPQNEFGNICPVDALHRVE
ncbi:uncharacterized protein C18orf63-like [Hypanus sabinus]|uniref:uncharacterized protein C18orf63-like n=1 Tax=Hypanus sabinus TaxID=79690 RepID=UPI0028C4E113|nr:uncharacterized protein C18orf63-like [Hypanus sabinus]